MKWKCPKKPCHPIKWEIGGVFRLLLAQLLQKALLLKYRCPATANDLQNGEGGHLPSAACPAFLISWPFAQGFCHLQIARAREDLSREGVGKGSHDGAEGRGKVAGSVGKIHKHIIERGRNFLCITINSLKPKKTLV